MLKRTYYNIKNVEEQSYRIFNDPPCGILTVPRSAKMEAGRVSERKSWNRKAKESNLAVCA